MLLFYYEYLHSNCALFVNTPSNSCTLGYVKMHLLRHQVVNKSHEPVHPIEVHLLH